MNALLAVLMLVGSAVLVLVPGGVLLLPLTLGGFVLALIGVFDGLEDRTVTQHDPDLRPRRWREGA